MLVFRTKASHPLDTNLYRIARAMASATAVAAIGIRALGYRELGCISNMSNMDELRHTDNTTLVPPRFPDTLPQREEALTETGQNSVPVPEIALTVYTTRLRGQLHTIHEDMDCYLNACLEELEAFMTLWDVKPRVEESSLETLSVNELISQLRQICEDVEDHASNAQEEAQHKRKDALEEVIQRIYRNNN
ncbi:hypothetical protein Tco_0679309 [Tanacetum coccineum]|uniref:Uncharacterized protein n=1 Tax=Tanacetum coccineum TaxID=301880 RepID=A0ABQ4XI92_9ASTR